LKKAPAVRKPKTFVSRNASKRRKGIMLIEAHDAFFLKRQRIQ